MGERYRIPGVIDLLRVHHPDEVLAVADAALLDREFSGWGPLVNLVIKRRITDTIGGAEGGLPSALPRDDPGRIAAQRELSRRLEPNERPWDDDSLSAVAAAIQGRNRRPLGELVQEAVGRLFTPDYRATAETWSAAVALDDGLRTNNPFRRLWLTATHAVPRARATLADAIGGDLAGVHATGIAVHTMLRAVERLGEVLRDRDLTARLSTESALAHALTAPSAVVRVATADGETAAGAVSAGTLVLLQTAAAVDRTADRRIAFLSESWSHCPAARVVPVMLAEIWRHATGERVAEISDPGGASHEREPVDREHKARRRSRSNEP